MPLYNTDTTPTIYRGMKRVMKRCWTVSHKPPSSREPRVSLHNNLQFAHQLRVLTNYGDINRGGVMAEGVCPKTQDTRGMSTLVSCNSWRSVSFAPRDFPAFLPLRRVFPRSEIFVCLRSIFHIVDVPPTIQQFRITNSVILRIFNSFSIDYSLYIRFYLGNPLFINHWFNNFFSDEPRGEKRKKKWGRCKIVTETGNVD